MSWPSALVGGALIGAAASLLLAGIGRVAGISGIVDGLLLGERAERGWRAAFVLGLLAGGVVIGLVRPDAFPAGPHAPLPLLGAAGLLVGVGTRLGSGCTSGHGVCGVARLSARSVAATVTFVAVGMLTTFVVRHGIGAAP